ncbi:MAG: MinD/ParA family protein [Desulfobacterales bacterium]|nr:MinD/ParA family protein [Desulfobacterales bacterium]
MGSETQGSFPKVVAVTSGKGGVGKTNIVGNMAVALQNSGKRVVIVDADVGLANIDIIFNIHAKHDISHVVSGEKKLSEIMIKTEHGIKIVPGGSGFSHLTQLAEGEKLNLLSEFETLQNEADIIFVDTGAGISSNVLYFNAAADECVVIATREPTSITDAYALMKVLFNDYKVKYFKLVVNMVKSENEAKIVYSSLSGALDKFLKNVVLEYVGYVTTDNEMQKAVLKRKLVIDLDKNAVVSKNIEKIAFKIHDSEIRSSSNGSIKFFMNKVLETVTNN